MTLVQHEGRRALSSIGFIFQSVLGLLLQATFLYVFKTMLGWDGNWDSTAFMGLAIINFFFGAPLYRFQKPGEISPYSGMPSHICITV